MEIKLFDDQEELLQSVRNSIKRGNKSVLMQAATGSGKTICSAAMVKGSYNKGTRSLFVVPRRELLKQTSTTYNKYDIPHSYVSAGMPFNPFSQAFVSTAPSLARRLDVLENINLLIIDECHISGDGIDKIIKHFKVRGAIVVGLSATPTKLSGKGMDDWFDDMVCGKSIRWLIDNNRLSDYRLFMPSRPDLSGIKTLAGDYNQHQLADKMEHDKVLVGDAVRHYKTYAMGKLGVTYTTSRKHSEIVAEEFRNAGIPATHIDGTMKDEERGKIIKAFANKELLQLVNCDLLTTGFDLASSAGIDVCIECLTDLQPTQSIAKQLQKWGRVLRYKPYPALIFDHASNTMKMDGTLNHGLPCTERNWSLKGTAKGTRDGMERAVPVQSCSKCYWTAPPWGLKCPACGDVREVQSREIEHIDGELLEVTKEMIMQQKKEARIEQGKARTLRELLALEKSKGYKSGWAFKVYKSRGVKR